MGDAGPGSPRNRSIGFSGLILATACARAEALIHEPFAQEPGSLNGKPGGPGLPGNWSINQAVTVIETPTLGH